MTFEKKRSGVARYVTITGARSPAQPVAQLAGLYSEYLRPFADPDATFYLGGAAGIDTSALDWLAEHTGAALIVVVPCAVDDQPAAAVRAIRRWHRSERLEKVVELCADKLGSAAYHARNRWMVDRSSFVIGFPYGTDPSSGTWYTMNYAAEQGKPLLIVPV